MPEPRTPEAPSAIARAKALVPKPVKRLLKPVVQALVPVPPSAQRLFAEADNWIGNRWTIDVRGRTHKFFFISGPYKSGTHWVQHILNLHPKVIVKGEFHFDSLWRGYHELVTVPWFLSSKDQLPDVATETVQDLVRRMMYAQTRDKPEATWIGDRTPRALQEFLPGAPNIAIRRDGRDVMVSWNFHHLRVKFPDRFLPRFRDLAVKMCPEFQADPHKYEQRGMGFLYDEDWFRFHARLWAETVLSQIYQVPGLIAAGTPVFEIRYEDLWHDVHTHAAKLYRFLDLNPSQAAPLSRESKTLRGFDSPSPLKFLRKGVIGEWREYFDENLSRWFKEEAGEALVAAGYEKDMQW